MRFAVALFALLLALPAATQTRERPNGVLLVAKPSLGEPNFRETVVLVTQAADASTVGVILNRPTARSDERSGTPVYDGGPVMREVTLAIFTADDAPDAAAFHVVPGVYLTMHPANIDALLSRPARRQRFYSGFAGWAPGQLARELRLDAWYVLPATEDVLFRTDTRELWRELFEKARGSRAGAIIKTDILVA
jgi:putative transcriptional regulator